MNRIDKKLVVLLHLAFWLLFLAFKYVDYNQNLGPAMALKFLGVQNLFNILAAYIHYFLLLPLLIKKHNYSIYALYVVLMMAAIILGRAWTEGLLFGDLFGSDYYAKLTGLRLFNLFWTTASFVVFISLLKFTIDRFILEGEKKALENEKLNAELNYLKAQVNPHFLFNTLHNLNYLAQVKSDQASDVVVKLSNIMRYMIYDSDKREVLLSKEIEYVKDYLALERIRLNHDFDLQFDTSGVEVDLEIVPLILIPFVENAFKHGVSDAEKSSWVKVKLESDQESLTLIVENSIITKQHSDQDKSGFGLENVRKRLNLSFPDAYELTIKADDKVFRVHLKLMIK